MPLCLWMNPGCSFCFPPCPAMMISKQGEYRFPHHSAGRYLAGSHPKRHRQNTAAWKKPSVSCDLLPGKPRQRKNRRESVWIHHAAFPKAERKVSDCYVGFYVLGLLNKHWEILSNRFGSCISWYKPRSGTNNFWIGICYWLVWKERVSFYETNLLKKYDR